MGQQCSSRSISTAFTPPHGPQKFTCCCDVCVCVARWHFAKDSCCPSLSLSPDLHGQFLFLFFFSIFHSHSHTHFDVTLNKTTPPAKERERGSQGTHAKLSIALDRRKSKRFVAHSAWLFRSLMRTIMSNYFSFFVIIFTPSLALRTGGGRWMRSISSYYSCVGQRSMRLAAAKADTSHHSTCSYTPPTPFMTVDETALVWQIRGLFRRWVPWAPAEKKWSKKKC